MGSPFTDDEKRFVLAELIKASKADMQPLVDFVKANCLTYSWFSVQLPSGRTVDQCIQATEKMLHAPVPPQSLKREPPLRPLLAAPSPASAPFPQPKQNPESSNAPSISTLLSAPAVTRSTTPHVPIQPRPVNGASHPPPTSPAEPPAKKRRGRPPRRQNLRCGSNSSPRPLQPLAPQPPVGPGPGFEPAPEGKGTPPGYVTGDARGQKRGRGSSDETEIKAEGSGVTPPARNSPEAYSESDGADDGRGP